MKAVQYRPSKAFSSEAARREFIKDESQRDFITEHPHLMRLAHAKWVRWAEKDWLELHERLLERSLIDLIEPKSTKETVMDITAWVAVPVIPAFKGPPRSFSFQACAEVANLDAAELQWMVLTELKQHPRNRSKGINAVRKHVERLLAED